MVVSTLRITCWQCTVHRNDTEGFVKNAVITPSVDFYRLEEVFVLHHLQ